MDNKSVTPRLLSFQFLKEITSDFSEDRIVGVGSFGKFYKGEDTNGETIAVMVLHYIPRFDDEQFVKEYYNIASLQHKNIVRLVGYCHETQREFVPYDGRMVLAEKTQTVLCFEYMPKGSLDMYLTDESGGLDWHTRYTIIKGVCQGLKYLHEEIDSPMYHLDLKPANISLDEKMVPKIMVFGISRLFGVEETEITTSAVGTHGYVPPEYIDAAIISSKFEIYSLGMVIIKIMTGPTGYHGIAEMSPQQSIELVHANWNNRLQTTSAYALERDSEQVKKCIEIALSCIDADRHKRPSIGEIINNLNETETKRSLDASSDDMASPDISIRGDYLYGGLAMEQQNPATPAPEPSFFSEWTEIKSSFNILEHMILDESVEPTNLPLALLQGITENFADERQIGRGGFGVIYKGDLRNGSVAVKRLLNSHTIVEEPFHREATSLISVKHQNIVRFLGYCANTERKAVLHPESGGTLKCVFAEIRERLLCFEYIKNGSLDKYLSDELRGLEWHTRYEIIRGICNGLVYLHKEKGIVHRDMKPANILLDNLMLPKITDFGISKLLEGATHAVTSNTTGSLGYCAPEFINRGVVSIKSDIYSLGVIIVELMTGCKDDPDIKHVLRRWRYRWNRSGKYPPLGYEQVTKCIEIALRCLSESPKRRPYVWDIVSMLNELESTNEHINSADESPVGPISPYPWELLEFDKLELNFAFEINKPIPCSLELTNVTDGYVAFDIEMTGVLQYVLEPNKGVMPPRSRCSVIVTLQPRERAPHAIMCKDEFVVRCAFVDAGITAQDITEDMFDRRLGKVVDEVTLKVVI